MHLRQFFATQPTQPQRRYSARYLLLIYEDVPLHFDPFEVRRLVTQKQARCTVVVERSSDSLCNVLAFVDFYGKRFQTRNLRLFDVQGSQARWCSITTAYPQVYDDLMARGRVIINDAPRPEERIRLKKASDSRNWENHAPIGDREDVFASSSWLEPDFCEYQQEHKFICPSAGVMPQCSQYTEVWKDAFRAGFEAGLSTSSSTFYNQTNSTSSTSFSVGAESVESWNSKVMASSLEDTMETQSSKTLFPLERISCASQADLGRAFLEVDPLFLCTSRSDSVFS